MQEQLDWEQECWDRGTQTYYARQDKLREKANDLTDAGSAILRERFLEIAGCLQEITVKQASGVGAKYNNLVRMAAMDGTDYMKVGYIVLKLLLSEVQMGKRIRLSTFLLRVGKTLEAEVKCMIFQKEMPAYFAAIQKSFKENDVSSPVHKQKVLMKKFNDHDQQWNEWESRTAFHVGSRVFGAVLACMGDLIYTQRVRENNKYLWIIDTTVAFDDWVAEFERERGLLFPTYLPLKVVPLPWESNNKGGYFTAPMQIPFVKAKGKEAQAFVRKHNPVHHKRAINKMQRTAWAVNTRVLDVQQEVFRRDLGIGIPNKEPVAMTPFPQHLQEIERGQYTEAQKEEMSVWKELAKSQYNRERQRKGRVIGFRNGFLLAEELRDWDKFHFVYNCDFRGRIYCATSGLSPQGADHAKGLLRFARGVRLGRDGVNWLAIQGANTYGNDKIPYEERVEWVKENEVLIQAIVEDPINNMMWAKADKPYQFLAFCFDWADCDYGRNQEAESFIPVGLDGSCNGLQHFSAMLKDEVGAKATNLSDCHKPEDIYGEVAAVVTRKLIDYANNGDPLAKIWLQVGITRKCAKRPVMTLPYGATMNSARHYVLEYVVNNWAKFNLDDKRQWEMAKYLTPLLWASIGEVVIAARSAMDWLQQNVGKGFCSWRTILGFPVYQHYRENNMIRVKTNLNGEIQVNIPDNTVDGTPAKYLQRNGISPNFVHSVDSTHMVLTINGTDLTSYAMIHDDFGTHAGNTEHLYRAIRKSFKYMYSNFDLLEHWALQQGIAVDSIPKRGVYNIKDITNARYFFG